MHNALVVSGVRLADQFQRVIALDPEDFRYDPAYPDVQGARDDDFVLIEILWSAARSVRLRRPCWPICWP